jgi:hypothetical protein
MIRLTFIDAGDEQLEIPGGFAVVRDWFELGLKPPPHVDLLGWIYDDSSGRRTIDALKHSIYAGSDAPPGSWKPGLTTFFKLEVDDAVVYPCAVFIKLDLDPSTTAKGLVFVKLHVERVNPSKEDWRGGSTPVFGGESPYSILVQVIGTDTRIDTVRPESAIGKAAPETVLLNPAELAETIALLQRAHAKVTGGAQRFEPNLGAELINCLRAEVGDTGLARETFDVMSKWIISVDERFSKGAR